MKREPSYDNIGSNTFSFFSFFQTELNLELLVKDEPIDWEETIDPSESLTIDHEIDIKPVRKTKRIE